MIRILTFIPVSMTMIMCMMYLTMIRILMFIPVSMCMMVPWQWLGFSYSYQFQWPWHCALWYLDSDQGSYIHTSFNDHDNVHDGTWQWSRFWCSYQFQWPWLIFSHTRVWKITKGIFCQVVRASWLHVLFRFQNLLWFISDFAQMKLKWHGENDTSFTTTILKFTAAAVLVFLLLHQGS